MGTIDFAPLFRSTVGFDRLFSLLDAASRGEPPDGEPPYDIEKTGEDTYRIVMAVAGFAADEITITSQPNLLTVAARRSRQDNAQYLHHGLATRPFEHRFDLADHVTVKRASLDNGLLTIDIVRAIPEAMKPRVIRIGTTTPKLVGARTGESQTAA